MACGVGSMPHSYASSLARLYRLGPMSALAPTPPSVSTAAMPMRMSSGTYGLVIARHSTSSWWCCRGSCCRCDPGEGRDGPVHHVAAPRLVAVGQELEHELHEQRPRQPVPRADPHDLRVLDQPHEVPAERVVAAQVVLHAPLVGGERALASRCGPAGQALGDRVGGD